MRRRSCVYRISALALSAGCWVVTWLVDGVRRLLGRSCVRCVALYYHAVRAADRAGFAWQMQELARLAHPVPADAVSLPSNSHRRCAMVTFDDGFCSVVENALPELARRGIPAAFFVPAGCLGDLPPWLAGSDHPDASERIVAAEELRRLPMSLVLVGSHSLDHVRLPGLRLREARRQLVESRKVLERIIGRPVKLFSAPHGDCDQRLVALARGAGYERVFGIAQSRVSLNSCGIACNRLPVSPHDWRLEFRLKLLGGYAWLPAAGRLCRWLRSRLAGK